MKNLVKISLVALMFVMNACSFANKSTVTVPINSNPPGANIVIDGMNRGVTPAFLELTPNKNYQATISKKGFGSSTVDLDSWYSLRGGKSTDGKRCMADVMSFVLPYFIVLLFSPEKCGTFKKDNYFVNLTKYVSNQYDYQSPAPVPQQNQSNPYNNYSQPQQNQNNYYQNYQQ
ncbi:MAG: hypothetical protein ACJAW3_000803 [Lentimonas sp.]|jgi:hypothetical protein